MKKIALLLLGVLVLSACTPKAYTEDMDAGKTAIQKGNYATAMKDFENALKEKQTDDAKTDLQIAKTLNESLSLYHKGDFDSAINNLTKLLNDSIADKADTTILNQAKTLLKEIQHTKTISDSMQEKITEGKTLLEQNQYDQAIEVFKQVSDTNNIDNIKSVEKLTKDAAALLDETTKKKNAAALQQQNQTGDQQQQQPQQQQQNTANTQNQNTGSQALTTKQAEDLVKAQLDAQPDQNVKVEYDHDAANGDYVIHVYEFVVDNPSTGEGHTVTLGWYGVNKQTKKVYNIMQ